MHLFNICVGVHQTLGKNTPKQEHGHLEGGVMPIIYQRHKIWRWSMLTVDTTHQWINTEGQYPHYVLRAFSVTHKPVSHTRTGTGRKSHTHTQSHTHSLTHSHTHSHTHLLNFWKIDDNWSIVINFPFAATSREVGYSPLDLKLLNNMCNCSHRNIKLLGDGLIAFTFNMLVYNFLSNLLRQLSP